jgi:DNA repair exonuclease SbcCD ATPase subunit
MNRGVLWVAVVVLAIVGGCAKEGKRAPVMPRQLPDSRALQKQLDEERRAAALQHQYIEDVTRTINEVQDQLRDVAPLEKDLRRLRIDPESGESIGATQREEVLSRIATVRSALQADAQRLTEMQRRNATFGGRIEGLEVTVARLQAAIGDRNQEIARLQTSIAHMTVQVDSLRKEQSQNREELSRRQDEIARKTDALDQAVAARDRAYVVIDTTRALVRMRLLIETTRLFRDPLISLNHDVDTSAFRTIDVQRDVVFSVPAAATRVRIYPGRSDSSYRLVTQPDGTSTLTVVAPDKFWLSRYLVVSIDR